MSATQKAAAIMRVLGDNLPLRLGVAGTKGVDASGNPTLLLGSGTAGAAGIFLRCKQDYDPALEVNPVTGNAQRRYTPHVIEVVMELSAVASTPDVVAATQLKLWKEIIEHGTKIKFYLATDALGAGVLNDVAWFASTYLVATVDDLWNPMTSTI